MGRHGYGGWWTPTRTVCPRTWHYYNLLTFHASLEYYVPIANTMFIQSNVSSFSSKTGSITGSLDVGVSTDPKDTAASVKVLMSYTGTDVREQTNVCLMNLAGADGLYIYVCHNCRLVTVQSLMCFI